MKRICTVWSVERIAPILISGIIFGAARLFGCGLNWDPPHSHFDGVDEQGHVLISQTLGVLNIGTNQKIPIYAVFKSNWTSTSPYLGYGWMLPLLESRIVQLDDNSFILWQPDGWYQYLGRDTTSPTLLNGQGGWKAAIDGDTITAWAPCGWKLTYSKGKITSMEVSGVKLDYVYVNDKVTAIESNGAPVLQVQSLGASNTTSGLSWDGGSVHLDQIPRPVIQNVSGKNIVSFLMPSLSKITCGQDAPVTFQYSLDKALEPCLTIAGRKLTWNPLGNTIISDDGWKYSITPGADEYSGANVSRSDDQGHVSTFTQDVSSGIESQTSEDGKTTQIQRFTSGSLAGKIRKVISPAGQTTNFRYDETGRLIGTVRGDNTSDTIYGSGSSVIEKDFVIAGQKQSATVQTVNNASKIVLSQGKGTTTYSFTPDNKLILNP